MCQTTTTPESAEACAGAIKAPTGVCPNKGTCKAACGDLASSPAADTAVIRTPVSLKAAPTAS